MSCLAWTVKWSWPISGSALNWRLTRTNATRWSERRTGWHQKLLQGLFRLSFNIIIEQTSHLKCLILSSDWPIRNFTKKGFCPFTSPCNLQFSSGHTLNRPVLVIIVVAYTISICFIIMNRPHKQFSIINSRNLHLVFCPTYHSHLNIINSVQSTLLREDISSKRGGIFIIISQA